MENLFVHDGIGKLDFRIKIDKTKVHFVDEEHPKT